MLTLYTYFRSTAAYRVRIALNLKGIAYKSVPVNLLKEGGENYKAEYLKKNPCGLVPTLEIGESLYLTQSMAILEYLEEAYPETVSLLPRQALARAYVRAIAQDIACDIHPLNNLRVLQYLQGLEGVDNNEKQDWYAHWVATGFTALEAKLAANDCQGRFCYGDKPTFADCCLVPQVYNAQRFLCDMSDYPIIRSINEHCLTLAAFVDASPEHQADAV